MTEDRSVRVVNDDLMPWDMFALEAMSQLIARNQDTASAFEIADKAADIADVLIRRRPEQND